MRSPKREVFSDQKQTRSRHHMHLKHTQVSGINGNRKTKIRLRLSVLEKQCYKSEHKDLWIKPVLRQYPQRVDRHRRTDLDETVQVPEPKPDG